MARTKRSRLPAVTEADRHLTPELVRRTPNGGWAWKCAYCGRYASDRSVRGVLICRCHGGTTPRQHDPVARYLHELNTGKKLNFPGRPMKHGIYSRLPKVKVSVILAEYHERRGKQVKAEREWIWKEIAATQTLLRKCAAGGKSPD